MSDSSKNNSYLKVIEVCLAIVFGFMSLTPLLSGAGFFKSIASLLLGAIIILFFHVMFKKLSDSL